LIEETDDAWIVEAELPGVHKKDVSVELRDSELAISGAIKERERTGSCAGAHARPVASTTASRCRGRRTRRAWRRSSPTASSPSAFPSPSARGHGESRSKNPPD
jgi:hypothetical protein